MELNRKKAVGMSAIRSLFSLQGRASLSMFWVVTIGVFVGLVASASAIGATEVEGSSPYQFIWNWICLPIAFWLTMAVQVKRWHDRDRTGWMFLVNVVPLYGWFHSLAFLGFRRGTVGRNQYGFDPLATFDASNTSAMGAEPRDAAAAANNCGDFAAELAITKKLASKGEAWAQHFLGNSYFRGDGIAKNYAKALKWYRLAAAQGYDPGQCSVGGMYLNGEGVGQNYAEALKWYRQSAAQGNFGSQHVLGLMYAEGMGIPKNEVSAYMWYYLAAMTGHEAAATARDTLARNMTFQQLNEAQKLAQDWQARNFKDGD